MRGTGLVLLLALLLSGCGCTDRGLSGRADGDEDSITSDDTSDDPASDAGDDVTDPPMDGPPSTCSIVEQTGCPEGQWCSWGFDEVTCTFYETCFTREPGTLEPGEECSYFPPEPPFCRPDSACRTGDEPPANAICVEWCRTDDDCSLAGFTCTDSPGPFYWWGPCSEFALEYPLNLCEMR